MADILIHDLRPRVQYVQSGGGDANTRFDFPFPVLSLADLRVAIDTTILEPSDFTTSGIGQEQGGSVYLQQVPAQGSRISIWRDMPFQRVTDFTPGADLRASVLNDELVAPPCCCSRRRPWSEIPSTGTPTMPIST